MNSQSRETIQNLLTFFFFFSILYLPYLTQSTQIEANLLKCLTQNSQPANPISDAIFAYSNTSFIPTLQSYIKNLRFEQSTTPKPIMIIAAKHESHVQATVICCKTVGLQLRIRSGGHDYDGLSYVSTVPYVLLDMFNYRAIDINVADKTAWVQAGVTTGELYYTISQKSKVLGFPAGVCTTLGIGGHISGGGYGTMIRKYGLSIDNVLDAKIVDVNGKILDKASMGDDLFWALRGGGGASFCVILAWRIKLVDVPPKVTVFKLPKSSEEGAFNLVDKWQHIADNLDENLFLRCVIAVGNKTDQSVEKTVKATFVGMYLGDKATLLQLITNQFPKLGLLDKDCIEMPWIESILFWFDRPAGTPLEMLLQRVSKMKIYLKRKSDYVKKPIPRQGLEAMWKLMLELKEVSMQWNPYGGIMDKIEDDATAFPHRKGNIFKIQYATNWFVGGDDNINRYIKMTNQLYEAMTPYVAKPRGAFLNYRDIELGVNAKGTYEEGKSYGVQYFGKNFDKLVDVKTRVDPGNFFRYEQSIPTKVMK